MEEIIKSMLKRIQWEHGITEISNLHFNLGGLDVYDNVISTNQDLFFVSFLPSEDYEWHKGERTRDSFISWTTYFKADRDVRAEVLKQQNRIIDTTELLSYQDRIEELLNKDELLSTYNAIVFSGNGFHVYWIWKETVIDKETYSAAATELFDRMKDLSQKAWTPELIVDYACSNISRLMRLPGSINHKDKYWLKPEKVRLLYYRDEDSELISELKTIWEKAKVKEENRVYIAKKRISNKKRDFSIFDNPLFHSINSDIDIADLVCKYTGWKLAENWKNFISNKDGFFTGAYILKNENIVVRRGTPHFSDYYPVYSPFSFIQVHYADWNAKRTFEIAQELYPHLKSSDSNFLFLNEMNYGFW